MSLNLTSFKIYKKKLSNGLSVLVKPSHHIPRVEAHLWYNVGSKDEKHGERGMAHLIEHMLFKGTKHLSESDHNLICQKLTANANAFTSQDYTCYTFRLPSHVWEVALEIFAECMQYARFDEQMLNSEVKTVIEELRLYKEDFQGNLLEQMISSLFSGHPYQEPIIGSKYDLCNLKRDNLYAFYKKHYHPTNAVLVITGDIKPEEVFEAAQRHFGHIFSPTDYIKDNFYMSDDLVTKTTTLFRPVNTPWYCYAYKVPGLEEGKNHLLDIASLMLAAGKSSRLYQRLVNKEKVAIDVDCSVYDFFEKGFLCIGVWPIDGQGSGDIEVIIQEELDLLKQQPVHDWEFEAARKRTMVDFTSLLESSEKQAFVIGNTYLATRDVNFIESYLGAIENTTKKQIQTFFKDFFNLSQQHKGYLFPVVKQDIKKLISLQMQSDELEQTILHQHKRITPIEPAQWANTITQSPITRFSYPKPKMCTLKNGLEVIYHHNGLVPQVVCIISFKANHLYEMEKQAGIFGFLLQTITDSTKHHTPDEFAKFLETEGIYLAASADNIVFRCLSRDFEKALKILSLILVHPMFNKQSIEKIRQQMVSMLDEFWQSPIDFIDQIAKEVIYQKHPYHKNPLGAKNSIKKLNIKDIEQCFNKFISPHQATLVMVGDFDEAKLPSLLSKYFQEWHGPLVPDITYPAMPQYIPQDLVFPLNRDQAVVGFAAPSIGRKHPHYNALALLDIIVTGGAVAAPSSRLFQLRETTGLFYTIGGSLIYGAREEPGMILVKTIVSSDKMENAQKLILETIDSVGKKGISLEELQAAKNLHFAASVELFESNIQMAQTFLFLKNMGLSFNLFDKQGEILSILKVDQVNDIAREYCNKDLMTTMQIGRMKKTKKVLFKMTTLKEEKYYGSKKSCEEKSS